MKRNQLHLIFGAVAVSVLFCLCSVGTTKQPVPLKGDRFDPIRKRMDSLIQQKAMPSMSIAVVQDGKIAWLESFGWADIKKGEKATPQTVYALGSLSKSLTATGVMTLVEQGKLTLDDSANRHLAPLHITSHVGNADSIKVWHLLNSCAGIPHGWSPSPEILGIGEDENFKRYAIATVPPGQVSQYSNFSSGILDKVIEQVSGLPLQTFFQQKVYAPLGMKHSFVIYDKGRASEFATLYDDQLAPMPMYQFYPYGGGGHFSSAEDLAKYALFYLGQLQPDQQAIFSQKTIREMHHFERSVPGTLRLGWFNSGHAVSSNGNIPGGNANLTILPEQNIAVVCLTNFSSFDGIADQIADEIVDLLVPTLQKQMTREKYMSLYETPYKPTPALTGTWSGAIRSGNENILAEMRFEADNERVTFKIGNAAPQPLERVVFNQYNKLTAGLECHIPVPGKRSSDRVYTSLSLFLYENQLVGYAAPNHECAGGSCCYGAFVSLRKG